MRAYDQACLMDGHNTTSPGQTALWCSRAQRSRSMERLKRTRERTRQRREYPQSFHHVMRGLRTPRPMLTCLWAPAGVHVAQTSCQSSSLCNTFLQPCTPPATGPPLSLRIRPFVHGQQRGDAPVPHARLGRMPRPRAGRGMSPARHPRLTARAGLGYTRGTDSQRHPLQEKACLCHRRRPHPRPTPSARTRARSSSNKPRSCWTRPTTTPWCDGSSPPRCSGSAHWNSSWRRPPRPHGPARRPRCGPPS